MNEKIRPFSTIENSFTRYFIPKSIFVQINLKFTVKLGHIHNFYAYTAIKKLFFVPFSCRRINNNNT